MSGGNKHQTMRQQAEGNREVKPKGMREDVRLMLNCFTVILTVSSFFYATGWMEFKKDDYDIIAAVVTIFLGIFNLILIRVTP